MPPPLSPPPTLTSSRPITESLDRALTETLQKIPSTGRGFVQADVAMSHGQIAARVEAGMRVRNGLSVGGWAGLARGQRLEAGARASWSF